MLTKFKKASIRAEILGEIAHDVANTKESYRKWNYESAKDTINQWNEEKLTNPDLDETWEFNNAKETVEEGNYRFEVYEEIIKTLEKML